MGLVNKVVPLDKLEDETIDWCRTILKRSPMAIRMIKRAMNAELDGQTGIMELAGDATLMFYLMEEAQEGRKAFLEKRILTSSNSRSSHRNRNKPYCLPETTGVH